jgi:hypothetical protein
MSWLVKLQPCRRLGAGRCCEAKIAPSTASLWEIVLSAALSSNRTRSGVHAFVHGGCKLLVTRMNQNLEHHEYGCVGADEPIHCIIELVLANSTWFVIDST